MRPKSIQTIELTNRCDNSCIYCPNSEQEANGRALTDMSWETLEKAVYWVGRLAHTGNQSEVYMSGLGESLLHPEAIAMLRYARDKIPMRVKVKLNTNGNSMHFGLARILEDIGIDSISVGDHRATSTALTVKILKEMHIPFVVDRSAVLQPHDWAGQIEWHKADFTFDCTWQHKGQVSVLSDGRISSCCIDAFGKGIIGHIKDNLDVMEQKPFELCGACHHEVKASEVANVRG